LTLSAWPAAAPAATAAKKKLKWGLLIGGALLAFCLLMLAANAGLTYAVVAMSKETSVQTSGVMTNKDGSTVIGTAAAAETADLLYAYHTPAEQSAALLTLKSLLISSDNSTGNGTIAAYQVLSSHLVPGQRLEFVVVAPSFGGGAAGVGPVAEMIRIIVDSEGVHEVRGGPTNRAGIGGSRRLLATPPGVLAPNYMRGSITGQLTGMTAGCGELPAEPACWPRQLPRLSRSCALPHSCSCVVPAHVFSLAPECFTHS
jgi:hypothetical protein